jgi:hypothetical protein
MVDDEVGAPTTEIDTHRPAGIRPPAQPDASLIRHGAIVRLSLDGDDAGPVAEPKIAS